MYRENLANISAPDRITRDLLVVIEKLTMIAVAPHRKPVQVAHLKHGIRPHGGLDRRVLAVARRKGVNTVRGCVSQEGLGLGQPISCRRQCCVEDSGPHPFL